MGLNSLGYRTDPGPQVVKIALIKGPATRVPHKEISAFITSGEPPPRFRVRWDEDYQCYHLDEPTMKEKAAFLALASLGYNFLDVDVMGEDPPLDDVVVEEH